MTKRQTQLDRIEELLMKIWFRLSKDPSSRPVVTSRTQGILAKLQDLIEAECDLPAKSLLTYQRTEDLVFPRFLFFMIGSEMTNPNAVARWCKRERSGVVSGIGRAKNMMAQNKNYRALSDRIMAKWDGQPL